jgi:hypothetical protein
MKLILIGYHGGCEFGFAFDDGLSWMMAFCVATVIPVVFRAVAAV